METELLEPHEGYAICRNLWHNIGGYKLPVEGHYNDPEIQEAWKSQRAEAERIGGNFKMIADMEDMMLYENNSHFKINDCGHLSMYIKTN